VGRGLIWRGCRSKGCPSGALPRPHRGGCAPIPLRRPEGGRGWRPLASPRSNATRPRKEARTAAARPDEVGGTFVHITLSRLEEYFYKLESTGMEDPNRNSGEGWGRLGLSRTYEFARSTFASVAFLRFLIRRLIDLIRSSCGSRDASRGRVAFDWGGLGGEIPSAPWEAPVPGGWKGVGRATPAVG
jgi:hypothetical protein